MNLIIENILKVKFMYLKGFFMMTLLYVSLLWAFTTDFFHQYSWMSTTVQYGPMVLAWAIIIVLAIFEALNKEDEKKKADKDGETKGKRMGIFAMMFLWGTVIALNFLVGEPSMNLLNVYSPEFWFFLILLPLLTLFNYKRKTDGMA